MSNMWKWNYIVAALVLLAGAVVCSASLALPPEDGSGDPGTGFWPLLLGGSLCLLALILAFANTVRRKENEAKTIALTLPANGLVYLLMLLSAMFCVVLYVLGFVIASLLFVPCCMRLMGARDSKKMILTSVLLVGTIYVLFGVLLKTPLPEPIFWR